MKVYNCLDAQTVLRRAGEALNEALSHIEGKALVLVSGGSTLDALEYVDRFPNHLMIGLVDERFSQRQEDQNWQAFTQTNFFKRAHASGVIFLPIPIARADDPVDSAAIYEEVLRKLFGSKWSGRVITLLGIGADGHIAGIMPYPESENWFQSTFINPERWVVGYDAVGKHTIPRRVTVTLSFLRDRVHETVVAAFGEEKHHALERIVSHAGTLAETPARILREMQKVQLFSDSGVCI